MGEGYREADGDCHDDQFAAYQLPEADVEFVDLGDDAAPVEPAADDQGDEGNGLGEQQAAVRVGSEDLYGDRKASCRERV